MYSTFDVLSLNGRKGDADDDGGGGGEEAFAEVVVVVVVDVVFTRSG